MVVVPTPFRVEEFRPEGFEVDRTLELGRHPILGVFPGLDALPTARRLEPRTDARQKLFGATFVELVDLDMWMYVAPREALEGRRGRRPLLVSPDVDCIVVGGAHLRESPPLTLFMDIYHELCHVRQRAAGADLFPPGLGYVERWTEVEAYRFVVDEARRFGVPDAFLRDYLRVEWISEAQHRELLEKLGVPVA